MQVKSGLEYIFRFRYCTGFPGANLKSPDFLQHASTRLLCFSRNVSMKNTFNVCISSSI